MKNSIPTTAGGQNAVANMLVEKSICLMTMSAGMGQSRGGGLRR